MAARASRWSQWHEDPELNRIQAEWMEARRANQVWGLYSNVNLGTDPLCDISANASVNSQNREKLADLNLLSHGFTPDRLGENAHNARSNKSRQQKAHYSAAERKVKGQRWIENMHKWSNPVGGALSSQWEGVRVLGQGGFGIAGLFRKKEKFLADGEKDVDQDNPEPELEPDEYWDVDHVVVKQARVNRGDGLRAEAYFMKYLNATGSRHFPKLYNRVYRDIGGQSDYYIDSNRREVHRIFMEYCAGKDLHATIRKYVNQVPNEKGEIRFISEEKVWSIFLCMAKALNAMSIGNEDPRLVKTAQDTRCIHFDIKPANILLDKIDSDEHTIMAIAKLADFGLMAIAPPLEEQNGAFLDSVERRGTQYFYAPEQLRQGYVINARGINIAVNRLPPRLRKITSATNVYQIGVAIFCLMTNNLTFPNWGRIFEVRDGVINDFDLLIGHSYGTIGEELLLGIDYPTNNRQGRKVQVPYSMNLKLLVLDCLRQDYTERPTVRGLLRRIDIGQALTSGRSKDREDDNFEEFEKGEPVDYSLEAPTNFVSRDPTDYWQTWRHTLIRDHTEFGQGYPKPLDKLLALQARDRTRREQVRYARRLLELHERDQEDDDEDADGKDQVNQLQMQATQDPDGSPQVRIYKGKGKRARSDSTSHVSKTRKQKRRRILSAEAPGPTGIERSRHIPEDAQEVAKRRRLQELKKFTLQISVYNIWRLPVRRMMPTVYHMQARHGQTIGDLKRWMLSPRGPAKGELDWSLYEIVCCQPGSQPGSEGYDLCDLMKLKDACRLVEGLADGMLSFQLQRDGYINPDDDFDSFDDED